jgi:hypothetical protein
MVSGSMRSPSWVRSQPEIAAPHSVRFAGRGEWSRIRIHPAPLPARNHQMSPKMEQQIVELRHQPMRWGARKRKVVLERKQPDVSWPAASTMGELLRREGLIRMGMRCTTSCLQTLPAIPLAARPCVVSRLAPDPVPGTQFGHRPLLRQPLLHKPSAFLHHSAHFPRHAIFLPAFGERTYLSTISPVWFVNYVPGPDPSVPTACALGYVLAPLRGFAQRLRVQCSAAVPSAVVGASRPHRCGPSYLAALDRSVTHPRPFCCARRRTLRAGCPQDSRPEAGATKGRSTRR